MTSIIYDAQDVYLKKAGEETNLSQHCLPATDLTSI